MIEFFLPCVPPTANHQNKKIVRMGTFHKLADEPELVKAKQMIDGLLTPYRPAAPMQGPVTLTLEFTWPWRSSDSLKMRARRLVPRPVRPDCSNLAKTTEDRLVAMLFLDDDAQVVELVVRKFLGDQPGIGVRVESCLDPVQVIVPPGVEAVTRAREMSLLG